MELTQPNYTEVTDVNELRALRGDFFQTRENSQAIANNASEHINAINQQIGTLAAAKEAQKAEAAKTKAKK